MLGDEHLCQRVRAEPFICTPARAPPPFRIRRPHRALVRRVSSALSRVQYLVLNPTTDQAFLRAYL